MVVADRSADLPLGYPLDCEADVVLSDGGTAHIRPIRPDDAGRLVALHGRLSRESIYYRFFSPHPRLSEKEVAHFTTTDYVDRLALVLILGDEMIAVARFDRDPQHHDEAECAFTVDDAHQRRGIATLLLEHLASAAKLRGVIRFTAITLPDNRGMGLVFRQAGFAAKAGFADGVLTFTLQLDLSMEALETINAREQRAERRSIEPLLHPRSIAVIGASARPQSLGGAVVRNLVAHGFGGRIAPVNGRAEVVEAIAAVRTIEDVSGEIDLAVIAVPAAAVLDAVRSCGARRVHAVVVIAEGLAEADQREAVRIARSSGMRLVGPASLGVLRISEGEAMHATFASTAPVAGRVALVAQSGPLAGALIERATRLGIGFSSIVSLGERADVSANDLLQYWADDPDTGVVMMFGESFGNPRKFSRIVHRVARQVPIVTMSPPDASRLSASADEDVYRQLGVLRVGSVEELLDVTRLLERQPVPRARTLAVISNASSPAALAAREARRLGLDVAQVTDLGFAASADDYAKAVATAGDAAMAIIIYAPPMGGDSAAVAEAAVRAAAEGMTLAGVFVGVNPTVSPMPTFLFPESAVGALSHAAAHGAWLARDPSPLEPPEMDLARVRSIVLDPLESSRADAAVQLTWPQSMDLLDALGLQIAPGLVVNDVEAAAEAAVRLGFPVALKVLGAPLRGRSEAGGVALDLQTEDDLRQSYARMQLSEEVTPGTALVQRMADTGVEAIITVDADPVFGRVVSIGLGGILADHIGGRSSAALPLSRADAVDLVHRSTLGDVVRERGLDIDAVVDAVIRIAAGVDATPEIVRLRCNPILVARHGAAVLSARCAVALATEAVLPSRRL